MKQRKGLLALAIPIAACAAEAWKGAKSIQFTRNQRSGSRRTVLFAALAGASVGFAIGLLTAPKPGSRLRADIGAGAKPYLDGAYQKAEDIRGSAAHLAQAGAKKAQEIKDNLVEKAG